jgi:hypothetical protein
MKIALDRKSLSAGKDLQLEAAVGFLKNENKKSADAKIKDGGNLGEVEVLLPPAPPNRKNPPKSLISAVGIVGEATVIKAKNVQDEKALKLIDDFVEISGGRAAWEKLNSLTALGKAELKKAGAVIEGDVEIYRKWPNKSAKVIKIDVLGEINEVFDGRESFVQTDFMGTQKNELWTGEFDLAANFRELLDARKIYPAITYETSIVKDGRKLHLIKGVSKQGSEVYFAFDEATKMLVSRAGIATSAYYEDYRKVGQWMFPFKISESEMTYKLTEVKPNAPVDDSRFAPKESCFTKID